MAVGDGTAQQGLELPVGNIFDIAGEILGELDFVVGGFGPAALDFHGAGQLDVRDGRADHHGPLTALHLEFVGVHVEIAERLVVQRNGHLFGLPGLEEHLDEALQLLGGAEDLAVRLGHVQLGHLGPVHAARIFQGERDLPAGNSKVAVFKGGVAQTESKGK